MNKYFGVCLIVVGTIMLVGSYLTQTLVNMNWFQFLAIVALIAGVALHIVALRKS